MNEHSSRSHAIFIVTIECSEVGDLRSGREGVQGTYSQILHNCFVFYKHLIFAIFSIFSHSLL